jgi:imidazolonepropionase
MTAHLIHNIGQLLTNDLERPLIENAAVVIEDGRVAWWGEDGKSPSVDSETDAEGCAVLPGFVDSHSHAIFAGDRLNDFLARMTGVGYQPGGIYRTVAATREASDDVLRSNLARIVAEFHFHGITTFEIKSGYGLDVATETRMLRIAKEFTEETTFLGAHVVAPEFEHDRQSYLKLITGEMLDAAAPFSKWIDVFCDRGAFTAEEAEQVLHAGMKQGLRPRLHGNQLESIGAVELAVGVDAASIDHCTHLSDNEIELLAVSQVVATLLPGAEFSTRSPYPDGAKLLSRGVDIALATDCNPGSSYISSMPLIIALAVREMKLTPLQAISAATLGGAKALDRQDVGRLTVGSAADLVMLSAERVEHLAYRPGAQLIKRVMKAGDWL